jgi:hypothetical protein
MKITIGHILILAGVGSYAVMGPFNLVSHEAVGQQLDRWSSKMEPLLSYIPYLSKATKPLPSPIDTTVNEINNTEVEKQPIVDPVVKEESQITETVPVQPVSQDKILPEETPVLEKKVEQPVKKKRGRKKKTSKPVSGVKTNNSNATSKGMADPLVGSYVALNLKSGREVKGVLKEHTATSYVIELPGMGPFTYSAETVVSVQPAQ